LTPKKKYQLRVFGLSILLGLSIASFAYLSSLGDIYPVTEKTIYVEDIEEDSKELLPDVQLIKMLMDKTLEFVTRVQSPSLR
jgi:hypothetical protein